MEILQSKEQREYWGIRNVEIMSTKGRTIMIYGMAGRGKTTLINTLKGNVLVINSDCGEQVLDGKNPDNSIDVFDLVTKEKNNCTKSIAKLEAFIKYLTDLKEMPWNYVILDNISELENLKLRSLVETREKRNIDAPDQLAYGVEGFWILNILKDLRNLTYKGCHVIYICWEKTEKISDFGGEVHSEKGPMLTGQSQLKINGLVDFVMAMRVDKEGNRFLQLDADHKYACKKRTEPGREYPSIIHCPLKEADTLQKFFDLLEGK